MSIVGVDLDDTIVPWYDTAHQICIEAGLVPFSGSTDEAGAWSISSGWLQPTTWHPWEEYGCPKEAWVDALVAAGQRLYLAPPNDDAFDALELLARKGHDIQFITARGSFGDNGDQIKVWTWEWFRSHQLEHYGPLMFSKDKTVVPTDWFVDDAVHNVQALRDNGTKAYLLTRPWNVDPELPRVGSVLEFAQLIIQEES